MSVAAGILLNGDQRRDPSSFCVDAADKMAGALGRDHHHVDVSGPHDCIEVNAEAVREAENFSGMEIGFDELVVHFGLGLIRRENVDPVGALGGLVGSHNHHAIGASLLGALAGGIKADDNFVYAVAEILGLRVSLANLSNACYS